MKPQTGIRVREPALLALETMRAHKLRSFLMLLGVILSVSTLILVVAVIEGTNRYIADRVANMGSNVFLVHQYPIITNAADLVKAQRRNRKIEWEDYEGLRVGLRLATQVGVEVRKNGKVKSGADSLEDVSIRGVTANIGQMDVEEPRTGRYISEADNEHRAMTAFVGSETAGRLFPSLDPIGKMLSVDGREYEIVGVAKAI